MKAKIHADEIFIVDHDSTISDLLATRLKAKGFGVTSFRDGESFAGAAKAGPPACVLMDASLPGRSGLEILKDIDAMRYDTPIVIMAGDATISMAVEAIKRGAFDVVEKPFDPHVVAERVQELIKAWKLRSGDWGRAEVRAPVPGMERLSQREHEVLAEIAAAASNKEAGRSLGLSPRTIEVHRAHIMLKLGAKNTADLMRIVLGQPSLAQGGR